MDTENEKKTVDEWWYLTRLVGRENLSRDVVFSYTSPGESQEASEITSGEQGVGNRWKQFEMKTISGNSYFQLSV